MPAVKADLRALPYQDVAAALDTVEASPASLAAKLCLRFLILTAARSGEARGTTWDEISFEAREWRIPANRTKAGAEHRVPLSAPAIEVLFRARALQDGSGLVFPSPRREGKELSDMTLTKVLRSTGLAERATVHGFRSAFITWASEQTDAAHAIMEFSLAHTVGSSVEQAYARSDLLEKCRRLMNDWASFVAQNPIAMVAKRSELATKWPHPLVPCACGLDWERGAYLRSIVAILRCPRSPEWHCLRTPTNNSSTAQTWRGYAEVRIAPISPGLSTTHRVNENSPIKISSSQLHHFQNHVHPTNSVVTAVATVRTLKWCTW